MRRLWSAWRLSLLLPLFSCVRAEFSAFLAMRNAGATVRTQQALRAWHQVAVVQRWRRERAQRQVMRALASARLASCAALQRALRLRTAVLQGRAFAVWKAEYLRVRLDVLT